MMSTKLELFIGVAEIAIGADTLWRSLAMTAPMGCIWGILGAGILAFGLRHLWKVVSA